MTISWLDDCKFTAASGGTGDFVVAAAVAGYQTPASAGAVNGATYRYRAESVDLTQWELGSGAYAASATTLARTTVLFSSTGGGKVNFINPPTVGVVAVAEDLSVLSALSGGVNKFRNGAMDVWQRGTAAITVTTAGAYTADGWIVLPAGASVSAAQAAGRQLTPWSLQITGNTSVTDVIARQRIEAAVSAPLTSQTVTVQAQVFNATGGTITPTLTVRHANAADNWSASTTDVNAVSLQACGNNAWTQVAYTFTDAGSAANGLEISFDFGNNFSTNGKSIKLTELDIRVTPGIATGVNAVPPAPELRPIGIEVPFCQRYLLVYGGAAAAMQIGTGWFSSSTLGFVSLLFTSQLRASPTMSISSVTAVTFPGTGNSTAVSFLNTTAQSTEIQATVSGAAAGTPTNVNLASPATMMASAEL